jgi:hypothetical protein
LKSGLSGPEFAVFMALPSESGGGSGAYQSLLALLAIVTGAPTNAPAILHDIANRNAGALVADCVPQLVAIAGSESTPLPGPDHQGRSDQSGKRERTDAWCVKMTHKGSAEPTRLASHVAPRGDRLRWFSAVTTIRFSSVIDDLASAPASSADSLRLSLASRGAALRARRAGGQRACISDEPDTGPGDNTTNDCAIVDGDSVDLRAERADNGDSRVYTIFYTVTDGSGNAAVQRCTVEVPR